MSERGDEFPNSSVKFLQTISKKLTIEILQNILTEVVGTENVTLVGWKEKYMGIAKGESNLSIVYRFNIYGVVKTTGKNLDIAVIGKGLPQNLGRRKTFRSTDFFKNEINFYTKIWKRLLEFQKSKTTKIYDKIPKCYAAFSDGENDFILLEDVSVLGYQGISRKCSIDLEHCKAILGLLAGFHATSLAFKDQFPQEYQELSSHITETYYTESLRWWQENFVKMVCEVWLDALEKEVPDSIYHNKFKELASNDYYGWVCNAVKPGKNSVINNGDAWLTNFLVTYTDNLPDKMILIDFQLSRNSSPVTDVAFFLYGCVEPEIRQKHWEEIVNHYHFVLSQQLIELGSNPGIFAREDLDKEFLEYGKFGIGSLECLPLNLIEDEEVSDFDLIKDDEVLDLATVWPIKPFKEQEKRMRLVKNIMELVDRKFI